MTFTIGLAEILGFVFALTGAGWTLIKISLGQFEKRLDEKLLTLDRAVGEIKRLELEIMRSDMKAAQTYPTKAENEKTLDRIFMALEKIESCMVVKITRDDVHKMIEQNNNHR